MHLVVLFPLVCLSFHGANGLIESYATSQTSLQSITQQPSSSRISSSIRLFSSSQPSLSNRTSLSSRQPSSGQQQPTSSVLSSNSQQLSSTQTYSLATGKESSLLAEETKEPSGRTGEDTSKYAVHVNSSALLNTTSSSKTGKDTAKLAVHVNSSALSNTTSALKTGKYTTKLALKGNSSLASNATLQEDLTARYFTYNVWTINSTDGIGNKAIWDFLVSLGVDGSDINVLGLPPGLDDTDAFQLRLNVVQYKDFNAGVSICCLSPRKGKCLLYVQSKKLGNLDFIAQACVTGCEPISNFIDEPSGISSSFSKRDFTMQFGRPWDQAYLSQPKTSAAGVGASMADINGRYAYDLTSAEGVTIYMVDTVRSSVLTAKSHANECFRERTRTTRCGSNSSYDDDDSF